MIKKIENIIKSSFQTKEILLNPDFTKNIEEAAELLIGTIKNGNKILIAGNGGSAADAQHFATELMGRFKKERKALPVISLTTDTSFLTAWTNDYNFESVFGRQIEGLGKKGDVFVGISTSGNSKNIMEAVEVAKKKGMKIILLLGNNGGNLKKAGEMNIIVPSNETPRIQEVHIMIIHILCQLIEEELVN